MTAATPAQAAAHAFVTGCVNRGITVNNAAVPAEGQLGAVKELWADVARAAIAADPEVRAFHRLVAEIAGYAVGAGMAHGALGEIQGKARALLFGDTPVSGRCPVGCGCRLGTDDADRRECGCDGPCTGDGQAGT